MVAKDNENEKSFNELKLKEEELKKLRERNSEYEKELKDRNDRFRQKTIDKSKLENENADLIRKDE